MIDLLAPLLFGVGLSEDCTEAAITTTLQLLLCVLEVELFWPVGGSPIKVQLRPQLLQRVVLLDESAGLIGLGGPDRLRPLP